MGSLAVIAGARSESVLCCLASRRIFLRLPEDHGLDPVNQSVMLVRIVKGTRSMGRLFAGFCGEGKW